MESKDEFQFKPLNEGLGFHKKSVDLSKELDESGTIENKYGRHLPTKKEEISESFRVKTEAPRSSEPFQSIKDPAIKFYDKEDRDVFDRPSLASQIPVKARAPQMDVPSPAERSPEFSRARSTSTSSSVRERSFADKAMEQESGTLRPSYPQIGPAMLDFFVSLGLTSIFAVPLLMFTGVSINTLIAGIASDVVTQFSVILLYVAVLNVYLILSRSFFFASLGEWAFDQSIGSLRDRDSALYPIRIALRTVCMTLTGVVLLPAIGMILERDYLGQFTGTELRRNS